MKDFNQWMEDHQVRWRARHLTPSENGRWQGREYPWILPDDLWEEGLWPEIRKDSNNPLAEYLQAKNIQRHKDTHNLKSSWVMCANLYFPFRSSANGRDLLASFLRHHVHEEIDSLEDIELEYAEPGELHPSELLGESGGGRGAYQTSPDLGFRVNGYRGLVLVESKFTEHSFYECSAWRHKGSRRLPGNPDPDHCNHPVEVAKDAGRQCHQATWGRRYWEHLVKAVEPAVIADLPHCPAMRHGFQLFRLHALAEGMARFGKYDLVISAVAVDERNESLDASLRRSGIDGLRGWGNIFHGKARFAAFTHQEWIRWIRNHQADREWDDWLRYIRDRYDLE